jgi:hypothetical protein
MSGKYSQPGLSGFSLMHELNIEADAIATVPRASRVYFVTFISEVR